MEKFIIFETAKSNFDSSLKDKPSSAFAVIEKIIISVNNLTISEKEKKDRLLGMFTKIKGSKEAKMLNVKIADLKDIINLVFSIKGNKKVTDMTMSETLYYFCSISRMSKCNIDFNEELIKEREGKEEVLRISKQEEEQQQLFKKQEEEEKLANMSEVDRKIFMIKTEDDISKIFLEIDNYEGNDKLKLADTLKSFWIKNNKWDGKLSKKQILKVDKIKKILGEN